MPSVRSMQTLQTDDMEPYVVGLASDAATATNLIKAVMGAAVFAMPLVFQQMGVLGASLVRPSLPPSSSHFPPFTGRALLNLCTA